MPSWHACLTYSQTKMGFSWPFPTATMILQSGGLCSELQCWFAMTDANSHAHSLAGIIGFHNTTNLLTINKQYKTVTIKCVVLNLTANYK